jgi:hypothetical protein
MLYRATVVPEYRWTTMKYENKVKQPTKEIPT